MLVHLYNIYARVPQVPAGPVGLECHQRVVICKPFKSDLWKENKKLARSLLASVRLGLCTGLTKQRKVSRQQHGVSRMPCQGRTRLQGPFLSIVSPCC